MTTIDDCTLLTLPCITREDETLTPIEGSKEVPFDIARVYYVYDVPGGAFRGGHAHRALHQLIACVMGCFTVVLDDGVRRKSVELNRAYHGLYVPTMIWRELMDFSSGAVCVVLASHAYDRQDYIYDYAEFLALKTGRGPDAEDIA